MRTTRFVALAAAGVLAVTGVAACGGDSKGDAGRGRQTDHGQGHRHRLRGRHAPTCGAGTATFKVTNSGAKVNEFYVYAAGDRVMGEVENIAPGLSRELRVELPAGTYETACKPGMSGRGHPRRAEGQRHRRSRSPPDAALAEADRRATSATSRARPPRC